MKKKESRGSLFRCQSLFFDSLDDLQCWYDRDTLSTNDLLNIPRETLLNYQSARPRLNSRRENERPLLTVCHDFKGGYQTGEDQNPLGEYAHPTGKHYWLRHMELVDEFIYFSHHLVTVPTVAWSNFLHRHGIPVLGTIILENFNNGTSGGELLKKRDDGNFIFVEILTSICKIFKFEGWLINFETRFPDLVANCVKDFVQALTSSINTNIKNGKVLWYDSYLNDFNRVIYQNEVNEFNESFFFRANRFLTNYAWESSNLERTTKNVGVIGMRNRVSVGIDVWGRSMKVGQGGMTVNLALDCISKFDANVMLFGPAWTYEKFGQDQFTRIDDEFWAIIKSQIEQNHPDEGFDLVPMSTNQEKITFLTLFSTGSGKFLNLKGVRVSDDAWVHLSVATPMPIKNKLLEVDYHDSYIGGSSLKFSTSDIESGSIHLFKYEQYFRAGLIDEFTLKVRTSFKNSILTSTVFLQLRYFVVRRGKKSGQYYRTKELTMKLHLENCSSWEYAETSFILPKLSSAFNEELLISDISLCWLENNWHDGDMIDDSWVIVPDQKNISDKGSLSLGLLSLEICNPKDVDSRKDRTFKFTPDQCLTWNDDEQAFMWIVLNSGNLLDGVTFAPIWPLPREKNDRGKVKIIQLNRNGCLVNLD